MTNLEQELHDMQRLVIHSYGDFSAAAYALFTIEDRGKFRQSLDAMLTAGLIGTGDAAERVADMKQFRKFLKSQRAALKNVSAAAPESEKKQVADSVKVPEPRVAIAFTMAGLSELGLGEDRLHNLPLAFREGMTGAKRAQRLGDPDEENRSWLWSDADKKLHGVLMVYSVPGYTGVKDVTDAGYKADALAHLGVQYPLIVSALRGAHVLMRLPDALVHPEAKGHFGFRDGISQPYIAGSNTSQRPRGDMAAANIVQPGEFVLGHVNESGVVVPPLWLSRKKTQRRFQYLRDDGLAAGRADFGRNGSYLVFRQLSMDKEGFNEFIAANAPDGNGDLLRAKIVGRWPSGAPLVKTPDKDAPEMGTDNDFLFMQEDRYGYRCPVGSHIRRSNPRDALANERAGISPQASLNRSRRARIIRRSRPYGSFASSEDADERGLHFICLNASLRDQFEFIQSAWVNNKEFAGLRGEVDPLIGTAGPHPSAYTMQKAPISDQVGMKNFVSVAGGGYFFMPGMNALRFIAG